MRTIRAIAALALLLGLAPAAAGGLVLAQTGGGFDLTWHTQDSGGGLSTGGGYVQSAAAGQPDAGVMAGGGYTLSGGFLVDLDLRKVYLPVVLKGP